MRTPERSQCERDPDAHVFRLAARQHGVVTRQQALRAGLTKSMVQTRLQVGRLERMHPGVYCVPGAPRTYEQRVFAAAAWAGPGAVVSHASAGHLWQMVENRPRSAIRTRLADMSRQGVRGPRMLRNLLVEAAGRHCAGSPLERLVAQVLRCPELPPFVRGHPVYVDGAVYYLDFAWPHFRVGVEADGRRWHSDAGSFERDRDRHNALTAAGWHVLRVTERGVRSDPAGVRRRVSELLRRG